MVPFLISELEFCRAPPPLHSCPASSHLCPGATRTPSLQPLFPPGNCTIRSHLVSPQTPSVAPQCPRIPIHSLRGPPQSPQPPSTPCSPGHHEDPHNLLGELPVGPHPRSVRGLLPLANSYTPFKVQMLPPLRSLPFSSSPWKISGISSPGPLR